MLHLQFIAILIDSFNNKMANAIIHQILFQRDVENACDDKIYAADAAPICLEAFLFHLLSVIWLVQKPNHLFIY